MAKVGSVLKTTIDVDSMQANNSLKGLKSIVDAVTNAWKSQEIQLKSTGNYLEASERRYNGLGEAMRRQKELIEQQVAGQKRLEENTKNMTNATVKETEQWGRYQKDIERAELKLSSMTSQQTRAGQAMEKEKAGIIGLSASLDNTAKSVTAYTDRLKAEHKEDEAVQVQRKATAKELEGQESLYKKQVNLLQDIAKESGFTSAAYKKQETAVHETGKAIAENKTKLERMNEAEAKAVVQVETHKSGLDKLRKSMASQDALSKAYVSSIEAQGNSTRTLITRNNELVDAKKRANTTLKAERELLESVKKRVGDSSDAYQKQKLKVLEAEGATNKLNHELGETQRELIKINPTGIGKLTQAMGDVEKVSDRMKTHVSNAVGHLRTAFTVAGTAAGALTLGMGASVKVAAGLQDQYTRTSNLIVTGDTSEASAKDKLTTARKQANTMLKNGEKYSVQYGVSQKKIAEGYQELVKRGYEGSQAIGSMKSMMEASVASGDDFNTVVHSATSTIEAYGYKTESVAGMAKNTSEVVNKMAYVADKTATDFKGMGVALEYAGSTAHSIGIPLSQTSAMIGILSNNGLEAQKSGTGMRKVLNSLTQGLSATASDTDKTAEKTAKYNKQITATKDNIAVMEEKQAAMTDKGSAQYIKLTNKIAASKDKLGTLGDKLEDVGNTKTKQSALEGIGLDAATLKNSNGEMKSVSEIMSLLGEKTKGMAKGEKAALFTKIFGTTGQQAAIILSENSDQIDKLAAAADKAAKENYVSDLAQKNMKTASASLKQLEMAAEAVVSMIGAKFLPVLEDVAYSIVKAFDSKNGKKALNELGDAIGDVAKKMGNAVKNMKPDTLANAFKSVVNGATATVKVLTKVAEVIATVGKFASQHTTAIKVFTAAMATAFVGGKIVKGIGTMKAGISLLGEALEYMPKSQKIASAALGLFNKSLTSTTDGMKVMSKTPIEIPTPNITGATSKWSFLGKTLGARMINGAGLAITAFDVGGSIYKAATTGDAQAKYQATGKTVGTLLGGTIGALIGGPGGAMIGAGLGDQLASTELAQDIAKKFTKSLTDAFSTQPVKAPKMSTKSAHDKLLAEQKKYQKEKQKQDLADLKTLKNNGMLTEKEYNKQVKDLKKRFADEAKTTKHSKSDQTLVDKLYAKQKQSLDTANNKALKKIHTKYDADIEKLERQGATGSAKYKRLVNARELATKKAHAKNKKAQDDLSLKYTTTDMTAEAKASLTLAGKLKTSSDKQAKILSKLTTKKGKLSKKQLKDAVNSANEETKKVAAAAESKYNKVTKAAERQYDEATKAAKATYKSVKTSAEKTREDTIDAANRQYKGNSAYAVSQREKVTEAAKKQYKETIKHAKQQKIEALGAADDQLQGVYSAASKQETETNKAAKKQKKAIVKAAKEQGYNVSKSAVTQANNSMSANAKQGSGISGIWKKIVSFFNGILKFLGIGKMSAPSGDFSYQPAEMHGGFATGGTVGKTGSALVGEAGAELRYTPYSGKVQLVGQNGAEFINLQAGERILNAQDTAKVMSGGYGRKSLPGYASGTSSLTGFMSGIAKGASSLWDNISDAGSEIMDKLTDPVGAMKKMVSSTFNLDATANLGSIYKDASKGIVNKSVDSIGDKLKALKKAYDDDGGGGSSPAGAGVQRWKPYVKKSLKKNGLSTSGSMVNAWLSQIQTESGGNEKAVQGGYTDVNTLSGDLAKGLLQTISATFNAYKHKGHGNIFKGYDNMLAAMAYAKSRYGGNMLGVIGKGHGYANGGIISQHGAYEIAEGNKAEAIIPLDAMKRTRGWELLFNVMSQFAGDEVGNLGLNKSNNNPNNGQLEQKVLELTNKMDILISALMQQKTTEITIKNEMDGRETSRGLVKYIQPELDKFQSQQGRLMTGRRV